MLLPETQEVKDVPKLIQPRDHRAKVCVWADLTVDNIDRINDSENADKIKQVLAEVFYLEDYRENLKSGIVIDLYYYTLQFAKENGFNREKTSTVFSIIKKTHEVCIETPFGNVDQTFNYFKELVLCHAVNRPPYSIELFSADEVRKITEYVVNTYFRHFKMYKYAFTPLVRLDLSLSYVGMPESPPASEVEPNSLQDDTHMDLETDLTDNQSLNNEDVSIMMNSTLCAGDQDEKLEEAAEGDVANVEGTTAEEGEREKTPEPEESQARQELRSMIQTFLTDEIKKMKVSVEEQIKSTEDTLNRKLDVAEGVGKGGKGGRGSAKGKKK